ncbi:hypothetical protein GWI33_008252 [Rhynchophorus ferrugineus]|uniref:Uncharacterized protein n=1 Tax=Rhynchophorus ferrugineus TaxID=354439 RepID=A0A834MCC8_RHYFE|nr:hypothetical protein GWI33_008252 [Rhynchophorus ferrugineus]
MPKIICRKFLNSLLKSPMAMNTLDKHLKSSTNERLRKIYSTRRNMTKHVGQIKRHNCLSCGTKSETFLKKQEPLCRPATRRNPNIASKEMIPARPLSVGAPRKCIKRNKYRHIPRPSLSTPTNDDNDEHTEEKTEIESAKDEESYIELLEELKTDNELNEKDINTLESPKVKSTKSFLKSSSEDHQYLLFLLRITEDIIVNDFYSNNDIKQVFRLHIEANRERLNLEKMHFHIANLCKELNINCPEYELSDTIDDDHSLRKPCNSYMNNDAFKSCPECSLLRTSSLHKLASDIDNDGIVNPEIDQMSISPSLLRVLEKLSLSRVTECTEPVPSVSTVESPNISTYSANCEKSPLDFDIFFKELNSKETTSQGHSSEEILGPQDTEKLITQESPLVESNSLIANEKNYKDSTLAEHESNELLKDQPDKQVECVQIEEDKMSCSSIKDEGSVVNCVFLNNNISEETPPSKCSSILPTKSADSVIDNEKIHIVNKNNEKPLQIEPSGLFGSKPSIAINMESKVKVVINGDVKDEDYVMVNGPVYILKALLQSDSKLIIFQENPANDHRRNSVKSVDSNSSHRTFTVETNRDNDVPAMGDDRVDQGIQFNGSIHSLEMENSLENILQLTRRAYSQFNDSKLLNSDYDLTPQRDNDDKYHHLLIDASSSISGVNLLLSDEYVVHNNKEDFSGQVGISTVDKIDDTIKPSYLDAISCDVISNMDSFQRNIPTTTSVFSQDSSLRSEGETSLVIPNTLSNLLLGNDYCK